MAKNFKSDLYFDLEWPEDLAVLENPSQAFKDAKKLARAEIDVLLQSKLDLVGIEAKFNDALKITPSMRIALDDLGLKKIVVVYPGDKIYSLAENILVIPLIK